MKKNVRSVVVDQMRNHQRAAERSAKVVHDDLRLGVSAKMSFELNTVFSLFSNNPPWKWLVPALETVVMSATPENSALLFDSETRISSMELKEGNISFTGPEYSTPTDEMPSMVTLSSAAVVSPSPPGLAAVVGLHAGLGGQR
jgi:hypothetical protein